MTCAKIELFKEYKKSTPVADRTGLDPLTSVFSKTLEDTSHSELPPYLELFNIFVKQRVENFNKPIIMTKPGLSLVTISRDLQQGHHVAPMYHPHAKNFVWKGYNPIEIRRTFSKYDNDRPHFMTEEQLELAIRADSVAAATAINLFKCYCIIRCFAASEDIKKIGACCTSAGDGMMSELDAHYAPSDPSSKGLPAAETGGSLEEMFSCFKDDDMATPLKPCCHCTTGSSCESCKPFMIKTNSLDECLKCIQKMLAVNKITATKATNKFLCCSSSSSTDVDDFLKSYGWFTTIKKTINNMLAFPTSKYNVCCDATSSDCSKCSTECGTITDKSIIIGCCATCTTDAKKCCCYNQTLPNKEDLLLLINTDDADDMREMTVCMRNTGYAEFTPENLQVGRIIPLAIIKKGSVIIINKNTIGIHPVWERSGSADYDESLLHNFWAEIKFHMIIYPFQAVNVAKPS